MLRKLLGLALLVCAAAATGMGDLASPGLPNDFQKRCQAKGVIQCFGFDSPSEVFPHLTAAADGRVHALVDENVKASGAGSLRFDIMPHLGANSSGAFALEFPRQFDSGEEFYVQWRQRFDREMVTHAYLHGEGWKQAIIGDGNRPLASARSCSANEVVLENNYHRGFPQLYHSCGIKDSQYEPLTPLVPPSDFLLQDGVGCLYSNQKGPHCFRYAPDQWMAFQIHIRIGQWYENQSGNYHRDSSVELWVAEENKPSVLVVSIPDYDLVREGVDQRYGRIWFLPYNTNKDSSEDHPVAHTWYDELIVSKLRIPDPGVATPNPPDSLDATSTSGAVDLKWRNNSDRVTAFEIERCAGNIYECQASQAFTKIGVAPAHAENFRDRSVAKGKRYTYRVRATNESGTSAYTNPGVNVPRPPRDLVAAAARSAVNLRWSANSQDETEFVVESCPGRACTNFAEVVHLPHTQNFYTHSGLTGGITYRYRVRSSNGVGSWITWDKGGVAYTNVASATPL